jgi:hypothetical protein
MTAATPQARLAREPARRRSRVPPPQAETALKKWSIFGSGDKFEDAAEKFQRAGNAYKAAKACARPLRRARVRARAAPQRHAR